MANDQFRRIGSINVHLMSHSEFLKMIPTPQPVICAIKKSFKVKKQQQNIAKVKNNLHSFH